MFLFMAAMVFAAMTSCGTGDVIYSPEPDIGTHRHEPPPWAPAHGYRAKYHYRYYPDSQVYYNINKDAYFYYRNGRWDTSGYLPDRIRIDTKNYVALEMDTDRPYRYHSEIKKEYSPRKSKKEKDKGKGKYPEPDMGTHRQRPPHSKPPQQPPWVPDHGHRVTYHYRYYPDSHVYYNENNGTYTYHRNGRWDTSGNLPDRVKIDTGNYVTLEMDTDRPDRHHSEVKKKYPPAQNKKNKAKGKDKKTGKSKDKKGKDETQPVNE